MTKKDDGGPAFPSPEIRGADGTGICTSEYGMSLRDWFAGQAIGLFPLSESNLEALRAGAKPRHDIVAEFCYSLADAMLAARAKGGA